MCKLVYKHVVHWSNLHCKNVYLSQGFYVQITTNNKKLSMNVLYLGSSINHRSPLLQEVCNKTITTMEYTLGYNFLVTLGNKIV